jgi:hypothetical protein
MEDLLHTLRKYKSHQSKSDVSFGGKQRRSISPRGSAKKIVARPFRARAPHRSPSPRRISARSPPRSSPRISARSPPRYRYSSPSSSSSFRAPKAVTPIREIIARALSPIRSLKTCERQYTKKYRERPSPAFPANSCCGMVIIGNDGQKYISEANKKGICTWKVFEEPRSSRY